MGIATPKSFQNKKIYWEFLKAFEAANLSSIELSVKERLSPTAQINGSHPVNAAVPGVGYYSDMIAPIAQSFDGFTCQNYIVLAGEY